MTTRTAARSVRRERIRHARLMLVAGSDSGGDGWLAAAERALASGAVDVLELRETTLDDAAFVRCAQAVRRLCHAHGVLLLLNDRVALVAAAGADGAHVGEHDLAPRLARLLLGPEPVLGLSTHGPEEVEAAHGLPVDYVGLGPCFPTQSKALTRRPGGGALVACASAVAGDLPVFAIGGITPENAALLVRAGARRLAVGAGILRAANPAGAALAIKALLNA